MNNDSSIIQIEMNPFASERNSLGQKQLDQLCQPHKKQKRDEFLSNEKQIQQSNILLNTAIKTYLNQVKFSSQQLSQYRANQQINNITRKYQQKPTEQMVFLSREQIQKSQQLKAEQNERLQYLRSTQIGKADIHQSEKIVSNSKIDIKPIKNDDPLSNQKRNLIVTRGIDYVPVDQYFIKRQNSKVLQHQKAFYSITLSQSNLAKDHNKFYIVQILVVQQNQQQSYYLYSRWGRVGVTGQTSQSGPLLLKEAIRRYNAKTQSKIKDGEYRIVEMSYEHKQELEEQNIDQYFQQENSILPEQVQQLIKLIFDIKMMQVHMTQIGYDQKRSPLGLIAKSAIQKGYLALDNVMRVLKETMPQKQRRQLLNKYSSQFFSAIPHDFGYLNMNAFALNTEQKVKKKLQMLASLSQIQIYSNLMKEKVIDDKLPDLDIKYSKLRCQIAPLTKDSPIYKTLQKYLINTHAKTHDKYQITLINIFTLSRPEEQSKFMWDLKDRRLLWHGSRLTNYVGILSEGLKIAPYQAPSTGYMFGKGIYFADIASKSANYCLPKHNSQGLMLLCEVALGQMMDKFSADYTAHNLPAGKHSTRGVGKFTPSNGQTIDEVFIPNGAVIASGVEEVLIQQLDFSTVQLVCSIQSRAGQMPLYRPCELHPQQMIQFNSIKKIQSFYASIIIATMQARKPQFGDIIERSRMVQQLRKSGKIPVKVSYHSTPPIIKTLWCDQKQPFFRLNKVIRESFKLPQTQGIFLYVDKKLPDQNKLIKQILANSEGEDTLFVDVATSQMF